ncbi:unnamed protein product [Amoebophrya sp. A25]|nr:unnamed protein product [Amoebophrya sp. A25]|eukprot:GSA25T00014149001.1
MASSSSATSSTKRNFAVAFEDDVQEGAKGICDNYGQEDPFGDDEDGWNLTIDDEGDLVFDVAYCCWNGVEYYSKNCLEEEDKGGEILGGEDDAAGGSGSTRMASTSVLQRGTCASQDSEMKACEIQEQRRGDAEPSSQEKPEAKVDASRELFGSGKRLVFKDMLSEGVFGEDDVLGGDELEGKGTTARSLEAEILSQPHLESSSTITCVEGTGVSAVGQSIGQSITSSAINVTSLSKAEGGAEINVLKTEEQKVSTSLQGDEKSSCATVSTEARKITSKSATASSPEKIEDLTTTVCSKTTTTCVSEQLLIESSSSSCAASASESSMKNVGSPVVIKSFSSPGAGRSATIADLFPEDDPEVVAVEERGRQKEQLDRKDSAIISRIKTSEAARTPLRDHTPLRGRSRGTAGARRDDDTGLILGAGGLPCGAAPPRTPGRRTPAGTPSRTPAVSKSEIRKRLQRHGSAAERLLTPARSPSGLFDAEPALDREVTCLRMKHMLKLNWLFLKAGEENAEYLKCGSARKVCTVDYDEENLCIEVTFGPQTAPRRAEAVTPLRSVSSSAKITPVEPNCTATSQQPRAATPLASHGGSAAATPERPGGVPQTPYNGRADLVLVIIFLARQDYRIFREAMESKKNPFKDPNSIYYLPPERFEDEFWRRQETQTAKRKRKGISRVLVRGHSRKGHYVAPHYRKVLTNEKYKSKKTWVDLFE